MAPENTKSQGEGVREKREHRGTSSLVVDSNDLGQAAQPQIGWRQFPKKIERFGESARGLRWRKHPGTDFFAPASTSMAHRMP